MTIRYNAREILASSFSRLDVRKLDPVRLHGLPIDIGLVCGDINAFGATRALSELNRGGAGSERSGEDKRDE